MAVYFVFIAVWGEIPISYICSYAVFSVGMFAPYP